MQDAHASAVASPEGVEEEPTEEVAPAPPIGGRFDALQWVGSGGASEVYEARDRQTGARVALKLFSAQREWSADRLSREVRALQALQIPGVVRFIDDGPHAGGHYIAMSFVDGTPFPGDTARPGWAGLEKPTRLLLETLARVHAHGMVHRDVKPPNVVVNTDGVPTLLDFGLARTVSRGQTVTHAGTIMGTPDYLAPEQVVGRRCDARTDLYAVGVMLFAQLTGRLPFARARSPKAVLQRLDATAPAVRSLTPTVPPVVAELVDRLLQPDRDRRPQSAEDALSSSAFGRR